jgi:hypothetical protein
VTFVLTQPLLAELRAWRAKRGAHDKIEEEHDAFCLDGGLGPGWYVTADGRVLRDGAGWDDEPLREATESEAFRAIAVGLKKTGINGLLALLPAQPSGGATCARCDGGRFTAVAPDSDDPARIVCPACSGLGWVRRSTVG